MPSFSERPVSVELPDLLPAAESLAEEKLSLLQEFLESLSSLTGSAGSFITAFLTAHGIDLGMDDALNPATAAGQVSVGFGSCEAVADGEVRSTDDMHAALGEDGGAAEAPSGVDEKLFEHYLTLSCSRLESAISMLEAEKQNGGPPDFIEPRLAAAKAALEYQKSHDLCE